MLEVLDFNKLESDMKSFFESQKKWEKMSPEELEERQRNYLKWRKIDPFEKRLAHSQNNCDKLEPNCYGTAFYLKGILPYDQVIFTDGNVKRVRKALEMMEEHWEPVPDSIMISFDARHNLTHASYILSINPVLGYHRVGSQCPLEKIVDIEKDVIKGYLIPVVGRSDYRNLFYTAIGNKLEGWAKEITSEYEPYWFA